MSHKHDGILQIFCSGTTPYIYQQPNFLLNAVTSFESITSDVKDECITTKDQTNMLHVKEDIKKITIRLENVAR